MKSNKISVIVPVYNIDRYLSRCIDSILSQTHTNLELLLVDDGSQDRSGKICDYYAEKDKRVKVFHKSNEGVGSARNVGLDEAKGEWISFIDGDDYISKDFLQFDYKETDIIEKSYITINEEDLNFKKNIVKENETLNNQKDIFRFFINKRNNALWNKIISKKVINNEYFKEDIRIGEDFLFFASIIKKVHSYSFSNTGNYYYVFRKGSAMERLQDSPYEQIKILTTNLNQVKELTSDKEFHLLQSGLVYSTYLNYLLFFIDKLSMSEIQIIDSLFRNMKWNDLAYLPLKAKLKIYIKRLYFSNTRKIDKIIHE